MSKSLKFFYTKTKQEIIEIISNATDLAFLEKGETLIKEDILSEKAQSIREFLKDRPFGCNTENVAKLMSLLLEEEIKSEEEEGIVVPNPQDLALYKYDDNQFYLQEKINEDDKNQMHYQLYQNDDGEILNRKDTCSLEDFTKPSRKEIIEFVTLTLEELNK